MNGTCNDQRRGKALRVERTRREKIEERRDLALSERVDLLWPYEEKRAKANEDYIFSKSVKGFCAVF